MKNRIIAIDLGHGETAAATALVDLSQPNKHLARADEVDILLQQKVIPTAYYEKAEQKYIGKKAIKQKGEQAKLAIAFKKRPSKMTAEEAKIMQNYLVEVYKQMKILQPQYFEDPDVIVGCPSGWNRKEMDLYSQLLAGGIKQEVTVIKESKAAIIYSILDANQKIREHINKGVLVIDFGSSTTDITYYRSQDDPINVGFDLGASRIEEEIFKYGMAALDKKLGNAYEKIIGRSDILRNQIMYACRESKEDYFRQLSEGEDEISIEISQKGIGSDRFELELDNALMEKLIHTPLTFDMEVPDYYQNTSEKIISDKINSKILGGSKRKQLTVSWIAFCKGILLYLKETLKEEKREIGVVILTGGASRMQFIRDQVKEIFKEAKMSFDANPSTCIAKGLAETRRADVRSESKKLEIYNKTKEIFSKEYEGLMQLMTTKISNHLFNQFILPHLQNWKTRKPGYITLKDMSKKMQEAQKNLGKELKIESFVNSSIIEWIDKMSGQIDGQFNDLTGTRLGVKQGYNTNISSKLTNNIREFEIRREMQFDLGKHIDFDEGANLAGDIVGVVTLIVTGIIGFICSYILVLICLWIICVIIAFTGVGVPVAIYLAGHATYFAVLIAVQGGDIYESISEKFGEGVTNTVKTCVGDPETKDYSLDKREKYYKKIEASFPDVKKNIQDKLTESFKDEKTKQNLLSSINDMLKESIEQAMCYASLEI